MHSHTYKIILLFNLRHPYNIQQVNLNICHKRGYLTELTVPFRNRKMQHRIRNWGERTQRKEEKCP
jgi:hypothetical protein